MANEMRDRLVELLKGAETKVTETLSKPLALEEWLGIYADHLIENGVIVPPCKVGDSIYRVGKGEIWEWQIAMAYMHPDETIYVDDSENEFTVYDIGKTVFLTKEQAEQKIKEMRGGNG